MLQLALLGLVAAVTWVIERRRLGVRPLVVPAVRGWRRITLGPWPLLAGAVTLAALNALTLVLAGHPWGITWGLTLWGGKTLQALGYDLSTVPFWSGDFQREALAAPVLADVTSVMDVGIVLGAFLGAGLAGRFTPIRRVPLRVVVASLLGGFLLGYGALIAFGCNIGAYFGGIASTSLHGWLWGVAALVGTPIGVGLRTLFRVDAAMADTPSC